MLLTWEHIYEFALRIAVRPRLKNLQHLQRFEAVRGRYSEVCNSLLNGDEGSHTVSEGYDWTELAGLIRKAFRDGVPIGFLACPMLSNTMVFARRRGIRLTHQMLKDVVRVFGKEVTSNILLEDYIGLPTISSAAYMTSANRCHHARHLAMYTQECKRNFWDCATIIEWGGGYGNMARIIRRMNSSVTYTIIDLPEILALQYVYLSSIEGEDNVHIVQPGIAPQLAPGKINLLSSQLAVGKGGGLECDSFISTWAITESPRDVQKFVREKEFFGARSLLLASLIDKSNYLADSLAGTGLSRIPVPISRGVGLCHEYWFR
jgi:hypothetical protein